MRLIEGYYGVFDKRGEFFGADTPAGAQIDADRMNKDAKGARYEARPVTIIEGDALAELRKLGIHPVKS